jgi:hypothetical protein
MKPTASLPSPGAASLVSVAAFDVLSSLLPQATVKSPTTRATLSAAHLGDRARTGVPFGGGDGFVLKGGRVR